MLRIRLLVPAVVALAATAGLASPVAAQSLYGGVGTAGLFAGYGHRYGETLGARAEVSWLPSAGRTFSEDGIDYSGDVKSQRFAALGDWHPLRGTFRLSVGLSGGRSSGNFSGAPSSGSTVTIGGATVPVGPADRYDVKAELPSVMPYVGIGWGHAITKGWGLSADVGVLIGSPKVTGTLSPSLRAKIAATGRDPDAELERELQTVRDTAAKIDVLPVLSLGLSYRW
ncbi:MAG: hypothetical protein ACK54X_00595 [Burkholderiales bacterium]|jgi:hypothetical protein